MKWCIAAVLILLGLVGCLGPDHPGTKSTDKSDSDSIPDIQFELLVTAGVDGVHLSWNTVSEATSYKVYRSVEIFSFEDLEFVPQWHNLAAARPEYLSLTIQNTYLDRRSKALQQYWYMISAYGSSSNYITSTSAVPIVAQTQAITTTVEDPGNTQEQTPKSVTVSLFIPSLLDNSIAPIQVTVSNPLTQDVQFSGNLWVYETDTYGNKMFWQGEYMAGTVAAATSRLFQYDFHSYLCEVGESLTFSAEIEYEIFAQDDRHPDRGTRTLANHTVMASNMFEAITAIQPVTAVIRDITGLPPFIPFTIYYDDSDDGMASALASDGLSYDHSRLKELNGQYFSTLTGADRNTLVFSPGFINKEGDTCGNPFTWQASWQGATEATVLQASGDLGAPPRMEVQDSAGIWSGTASFTVAGKDISINVRREAVPVTADVQVKADSVVVAVTAPAESGYWTLYGQSAKTPDPYALGTLPPAGGHKTFALQNEVPCTQPTPFWINEPTELFLEGGKLGAWYVGSITGYTLTTTSEAGEPDTSPADAQTVAGPLERFLFGEDDVDWFAVTVTSGIVTVEVENLNWYFLFASAAPADHFSVLPLTYKDGTIRYEVVINPLDEEWFISKGSKRTMVFDSSVAVDWRIAVAGRAPVGCNEQQTMCTMVEILSETLPPSLCPFSRYTIRKL